MAFNLVVAGQKTLSKFLRGFKIAGFVDSIQLRGYRLDKDTGICTFGLRLRGFSGGNLDLEVPMAFDVEKGIVQEPVLAFIDGRTHLISQGMFNKLMDRLNLEKKWAPGWMDVNREVTEFRTVRQNDPNKYKVASQHVNDPEYAEAFEDFNICLAASPETLHRAIALRAFTMLNKGFSRKATLHRMADNFLGATTFNNLNLLIEHVCSLMGRPSELALHVGMRKLSQGDEEEVPLTEEEKKRREEEEILEGVPLEEKKELTPELTPEEAQPLIQEILTGPLPEGIDIYTQDVFQPVLMEEAPLPEAISIEEITTPFISTPAAPIPWEEYMPQTESPHVTIPIIKPSVDQILDVIKTMRILEFIYTKMEGEQEMRKVMPHYIWNTDNGRQIVMSWDPNAENGAGNWRSFDLDRISDPGVRVNGEDTDLAEFLFMLQDDPEAMEKSKQSPQDFFMPDPKNFRHTEIVRQRLHATHLKELKRFYFRSGSILKEKINYMIKVLEGSCE